MVKEIKKKVIFKGGRSKVTVDGEDQYGAKISFKHPSTKLDIAMVSSLALAKDGSKISSSALLKYVSNPKKKTFKSFGMSMDIYPELNEIRFGSEMPFGETSLTGRYEWNNYGLDLMLSGDVLKTPIAFKVRGDDYGYSGVYEYGAQIIESQIKFVSPFVYEEVYSFTKNGKEVTRCVYKHMIKTENIAEISYQCPDGFYAAHIQEFSRLYNSGKTLMTPHLKKLSAEMKKKRFMYMKFAKLTYNSPQMAIIKMVGDKTVAYRKQMMANIKQKVNQGKKAVAGAMKTIAAIDFPFESQSDFLNFLRNQVEVTVEKVRSYIEKAKAKVQGLLDSSSESSAATYLAKAISDGKEKNLIMAIRKVWKEAEQEIKAYYEQSRKDLDYLIDYAQNRYIADRLKTLRNYIDTVVNDYDVEKYVKIPVLSFVQDLINQGDESTKTVDKLHDMLKEYLKPELTRITEWDTSKGNYAFEYYSPEKIEDFDKLYEDASSYIDETLEPIKRRFGEISRNFEFLRRQMDVEIQTVDMYDLMRFPSGMAKINENSIVTFDGAESEVDLLCMFDLVSIKEQHPDGEDFSLSMSGDFHFTLQSGQDSISMLRRLSEDDWFYQLQVNGREADFYDSEFAEYSHGAYKIFTPNRNLKVSCYKDNCNVELISWYFNNVFGALGNFNSESSDDRILDYEVGCS